MKRQTFTTLTVLALCLLPFLTLFIVARVIGCLIIRDPTVDLLLRIHVGMTQAEVRQAVGPPKGIYPPERFDDVYNGWYPKPRVRATRPVWVYEVFHSIRIVVYWNESGRLQYFDVVYT